MRNPLDWKNLLAETVEYLTENGKTPADVEWVGSHGTGQVGSWAEFAALADRTYYSGHGTEAVEMALIICGSNWWMDRRSDDGMEWWEFQCKPTQPYPAEKLTAVFDEEGMSYNSLPQPSWQSVLGVGGPS